jgi:hypothetical protein
LVAFLELDGSRHTVYNAEKAEPGWLFLKVVENWSRTPRTGWGCKAKEHLKNVGEWEERKLDILVQSLTPRLENLDFICKDAMWS